MNSDKNYDNQFLHHKAKFETDYAYIINEDIETDLEINGIFTLEGSTNAIKHKTV